MDISVLNNLIAATIRWVSIYNSGKSSYSGYRVSTYDDWCDIFVSSMYQHSGLIDLIDKEAYVPYHISLMKIKGFGLVKQHHNQEM